MIQKLIPENQLRADGTEIKRSIALEMVKNYRAKHGVALNNNGYTPTRSIYFTIDELQAFLEKMEDASANGCRMYFAAVTQNSIDEYAPGQDYLLDAMTVVLVTTRTNENNMHEELLSSNDSIVNPAFDFGTLCPPSGGCQKIIMSSGNSLDFDAMQS
jgi:hypothetical protein